ncbi:hypothetical protein ABEX25_23350 [Paenibacillus thiaminolyticus]|uniref:phage tail protein n=1 Tax=Paenibacillus thiaminolyticus TaxID=49283 RepID=UPI003D2C53B8
MSEEVGKVSLGLEFTGDFAKQISAVAGEIGKHLSKSLDSALKGLDFGASIKEAFKDAVVDVKEIERSFDGVAEKMKGIKVPFPGSAFNCCCNDGGGNAASSSPAPAPKATTKSSKAPLDVEATKAEIERLTQVMDNTNAKIELQQQKLANLKESYENTFNEAQKFKIQEKILNTEAVILRLTKSSDDTAQKIWQLDDALQQATNTAQQSANATQQVTNANQQAAKSTQQMTNAAQQSSQASNNAANSTNRFSQATNNTNQPLKAARGNLNAVSKAAKETSNSFGQAAKSAGNMGNSFTRAFSRVFKQVFVFAILYKAIRDFNQYLGSSLKTNQQFAASLNAIKTNLRVAFQPIYDAILPAINALMSWLAKATAYIAAFISALFGKTYQQSYQAAKGIETAKKNLDGYGKAAKKAGKEAKGALASFDELNTLDMSKSGDDSSAGGGGGPGDFEMAMPDMDITGIQSQMDALAASIKSSFGGAWDFIRSGWATLVSTFGPSFSAAWAQIAPVLEQWKMAFGQWYNDLISLGEPLKNWIMTGVVPLWQKGIVMMGGVLAGFLDSALQLFNSLREAVYPILQWFVTNGLPILTEFLSGALDIFWSLFSGAKQIFDDLWQGVVDPVMKLISKIILDTLNIIKGFWDDWGKQILAGVKQALDGIKQLWNNLWNSFLKPFVTNMLKMLTDLWDKHLKGLIKEIGNFVGKLATAATDIFNKFVMPIINWLVQKLGPTFSNIFSLIGDVIGTAAGVIADVAKGIIKTLGGIVDFIAGVLILDWERTWNGMKDIFTGIIDAIVGVFKGAINLLIDGINFFIRQANKLSFDVPEMFGGGTIGVSLPEIPKLAKGGLAYGPTLAMVGDNKGAAVDPEVVSPLSKLQDMIGANNQPVVEALYLILEALKSNDKQTVLQIGETEFGRLAVKSINSAQRQAGRTLLNV